jgi:hypothetical protein
VIDRLAARAWIAPVVLAAAPALLALWYGGYHPRHAGWLVLGLAGWACMLAALGRLGALRSVFGLASTALLALVAWTTASIWWADASMHEAWVEAMRALGLAAMFLVAGGVLASARAYARYATLAGAATAVLAAAATWRLVASDAPLRNFVAGRLDWPLGYAPGLAGLCLMGTFLLLGSACAAQQRWERRGQAVDIVAGGAALAGATTCASIALLAQSRGTVPAILVGTVVALIATPGRGAWLLRTGTIVALLAGARNSFAEPFRTQFDLRQAPFTEGADEQALLAVSEAAARDAGIAVLVVALLAGIVGAVLVPVGVRVTLASRDLETRIGVAPWIPASVVAVAVVATLLVIGGSGERSPASWVSTQWNGCVNPPDTTNDPGSSTSYFATSGTGRCDYYRVALASTMSKPLLGLGAGNFRGEYVRERRTREEPRFVHSLPLQLSAELGIVGLLLGATVLGCVGVAAARFVRSGAARDATFAGAIAALGYWVAHASIDWLWQLPAVSLPAFALAGGLVACVSPRQQPTSARVAIPFMAGAFVACVALVLPLTMADSALRRARDSELVKRDPDAALAAARDARSFDPTWAEASIIEGGLLAEARNNAAAANAGRRAVQLEPRSWAVQLGASGLIGLDDQAAGLVAYRAAQRLNPSLESADAAGDEAARAPLADALQSPPAG